VRLSPWNGAQAIRQYLGVGIAVQVREFTGEVVERLSWAADIKTLCDFVGDDPTLYPLLAGVDPYDDTCFNPRQATLLAAELRQIAQRTDGPVQAVAMAVLGLTSLLEAAPGRPGHRRLVFIGD
jgi:hypothetical protein